jgi:RNA polymerase sigma factor (sigma-70 family)
LESPQPAESSGEGLPGVGAGAHERDLELARAALAGSPQARREFVDLMACVPKFLAVMNARLGRPFSDDALEDVVQETLVEIWRRLDSYAGHASLKTWAFRFCQQVLSSRLRSVRRRPPSVGLVSLRDPGGARLTSSLDYEHVYQALEKVDGLGARIVRHKHFDHLTLEEIARRLNMPPSSVKTHYQRTLSRLREILDPLRKEAGL